MRSPAATYRLQLSRDVRFADVRQLVGYLDSLGITDVYCSPILAAREGSPHGYDITDHGRLNAELGDDADLRALSAALRARGMGLIVDFVPNHMAADAGANRWWRDVLENGPSSPYARFFDIDWQPARRELRNKVLLPILGDQYGVVLERGELTLDLVDGAFVIRYFERMLPVDAKQAVPVLQDARDRLSANPGPDDRHVVELGAVIDLLAAMPEHTCTTPVASLERQDVGRAARQRLVALLGESAAIRQHLQEALHSINGQAGASTSFDRLHALLDALPYRLAFWRTALDEINYRRFFDVNDLAGLRVESPAVFAAAHALLLDLIEERIVTGIRIDHPDGLYDPAGYFHTLAGAIAERIGNDAVYVVAEKILGRDERLRSSWPVHGTTGYNALSTLNGLFVHPEGLGELRRTYKRVARFARNGPDTTRDAKAFVMRTALASELQVLATALSRLAEADRRYRDFTVTALRRVLIDIIACFPVYRTYVTDEGADETDAAVVDAAIAEAQRRSPLRDPAVFAFVRDALLPSEHADVDRAPEERHLFARRFQQYTAAVAAKGLEDTAFYNDVLLLSTNEVGGDLERRTRSAIEFHEDNQRRLSEWPLELTAASTHDTKRGEDARARISVIAELEDDWRQHVGRWIAVNRHAHADVAGARAPDRNDEWMFYQALVGAWPAERLDAPVPATADADLVERMRAFMGKAVREAKRHTSWLFEHPAYERAVDDFTRQVLAGPQARRFLASFAPFVRRLSWFGMFGSLAQATLRIAGPGIPDIYQGSELWNLALVDPDNRRPVDVRARCQMLSSMERILARPDLQALGQLLEDWPDGRPKMFTLARALRMRRADPDLFVHGAYEPLAASDDVESHVVAFARHRADKEVVVAVPRFAATLLRGRPGTPMGKCWGAGTLTLPGRLAGRRLINVLTRELHEPAARNAHSVLALSDLFRAWPVAILEAGDESVEAFS